MAMGQTLYVDININIYSYNPLISFGLGWMNCNFGARPRDTFSEKARVIAPLFEFAAMVPKLLNAALTSVTSHRLLKLQGLHVYTVNHCKWDFQNAALNKTCPVANQLAKRRQRFHAATGMGLRWSWRHCQCPEPHAKMWEQSGHRGGERL